eukprot:SAG31_NODE_6967_length_1832_cov_1.098096_1_plen_352_part_10
MIGPDPNRRQRIMLTNDHERVLEDYFNQFDDHGEQNLSQTEIINLLMRLGICHDKLDAIELMETMDKDNDGRVDLGEFLGGMDRIVRDGIMTLDEFDRMMSTPVKFGYAGTTWRKQENVLWMMNTGVMIISVTVVLGLLIYFRFILVPLTMAYLGTFLLGPLMDFFYQRPLIFAKKAWCSPVHYTYEVLVEKWKLLYGEEPLPMVKTAGNDNSYGQLDHPDPRVPVPPRFLNSIPYREGEYPFKLGKGKLCFDVQVTAAECIFLFKLPFILSLLLTLSIAAFFLIAVILFCFNQITDLLNDHLFMEAVYDLRDDLDKFFKDNGYTVSELQRKETEPETLALVISLLNMTSVP